VIRTSTELKAGASAEIVAGRVVNGLINLLRERGFHVFPSRYDDIKACRDLDQLMNCGGRAAVAERITEVLDFGAMSR
jgi:hypothetical protein